MNFLTFSLMLYQSLWQTVLPGNEIQILVEVHSSVLAHTVKKKKVHNSILKVGVHRVMNIHSTY